MLKISKIVDCELSFQQQYAQVRKLDSPTISSKSDHNDGSHNLGMKQDNHSSSSKESADSQGK